MFLSMAVSDSPRDYASEVLNVRDANRDTPEGRMQVLLHNAFPLRFDLRNRLAALRGSGPFFMIRVRDELYGQEENSLAEVSENQEEDFFEKVPQVTT